MEESGNNPNNKGAINIRKPDWLFRLFITNPELAQKLALINILRDSGIEEYFDTEAIREVCLPAVLAELEVWNVRDQRGEEFASYIYPYLYKQNTLPMVFVGNTYIPAIAHKGNRLGYKLMITTSLTRENLESAKIY
ncbi:MAG: hypothetical protein NZM26_04095 [Patescibacteria group bacterium]|nr:hypothetical protein [Patescibacteria group bacterium]